MQPKEGYYAALERQRVGEASVRNRFDDEKRAGELDALEGLYTEVGMKAFTAFNNCLDWLSHLGGGRSMSPGSEDALRKAIQESVVPALRELQDDIAAVQERIGKLEGNIASLEAGMRRIDKFTLEAFRNIKEIEERSHVNHERLPASSEMPAEYRGRLAKEEAASLALEAARRMKSQGRRLTLAAVAREAGLKYGQIVYAFGNKDGFLDALQSEAGEPSADYPENASA